MKPDKNTRQGLALMIFAIVIISLCLFMQLTAGIQNNNHCNDKATVIQDAFPTPDGDCEIVIKYNEPGSAHEHRKPDGKPLVITRRMQDALISVPLGTEIDFTTDGITTNGKTSESVVLNNYDNTAFTLTRLSNGFRLTVRKDIPEGRARTTDISVNGQPFWLEFSFSRACNK